MLKALQNSNLVFLLAIATGLILPIFSGYLAGYVLPALIVIMTLSMTQIIFSTGDITKNLEGIFVALLINYVFLSGVIIFSSSLLLEDPMLKAGFVIMAAVPPAISVVPFTNMLKGDKLLSLISTAFLYLISPILAPVIVFYSAGFTVVETNSLIKVLFEMILIPLILSRALIKSKYDISKNRDAIINACYFILVYAVVGINRAVFFQDFGMVFAVSAVCFLRTVASGTFVYFIAKRVGAEKASSISYALLGSYKNLGLTATMALALLGGRASIPAAICIPFEVVFFTYFSRLVPRY